MSFKSTPQTFHEKAELGEFLLADKMLLSWDLLLAPVVFVQAARWAVQLPCTPSQVQLPHGQHQGLGTLGLPLQGPLSHVSWPQPSGSAEKTFQAGFQSYHVKKLHFLLICTHSASQGVFCFSFFSISNVIPSGSF